MAGGTPFDIHKEHDLEVKLAKYVRSYLAVRGQENEVEQDQLRWICAAMGRLLDGLLDGNNAWNPYYWVDDISPGATEVLEPGHLKIDGLLIWGDVGNTKEWWEPFSGAIQISETNGDLLGYQLMFGDTAWGLGKVRYNQHPRGWNWSPPEKWIFVFTIP